MVVLLLVLLFSCGALSLESSRIEWELVRLSEINISIEMVQFDLDGYRTSGAVATESFEFVEGGVKYSYYPVSYREFPGHSWHSLPSIEEFKRTLPWANSAFFIFVFNTAEAPLRTLQFTSMKAPPPLLNYSYSPDLVIIKHPTESVHPELLHSLFCAHFLTSATRTALAQYQDSYNKLLNELSPVLSAHSEGIEFFFSYHKSEFLQIIHSLLLQLSLCGASIAARTPERALPTLDSLLQSSSLSQFLSQPFFSPTVPCTMCLLSPLIVMYLYLAYCFHKYNSPVRPQNSV